MNKNLLITGGSSGIGKACVHHFLQHGWNVCFTYHSNSQAALDICKTHQNAFAVKTDCTKSEEIKHLVSECLNRFGDIDAVIANAGVTARNQIQDIDDAELKYIFDVNFFGAFYLFREVTPHLVKNKYGRLLAISSVFSHSGGSCETHYSASKAALNGLVTSLSCELAPSGITVNAIAPGIVDTPMNNNHDKEELASLTPQNRLCSPKEIASTAYFLSCEQSRFITGQILCQDGGVHF